MLQTLLWSLGSLVLISVPVCAGENPLPRILDDETFEAWRDFIHPSAAELASERIDWNPTLWAGLMRAQEVKKPLMIWIMNGHPCGLT